jgi:hypothetical protein
MGNTKSTRTEEYPAPEDDEEPLALEIDWTYDEEVKAKRK